MPIASAPRSGTARRCWNSISITEVVAGGCPTDPDHTVSADQSVVKPSLGEVLCHESGRPMFYSVDRRGFYRTGGTLDLWQQDPLGRPFWRLPDWFEADDARTSLTFSQTGSRCTDGNTWSSGMISFARPTLMRSS